ncbi:MAG: class I SAM-dependent methyltransferase [Saprospiraceae bacterium]|nr:class I SAM-dependent methyltransferase [Saprospiraceae bacterium]
MDWVKEFYTCQNEWFGVYLVDVEERHRERAKLIHKLSDNSEKMILELGAGGGQTSIALAESGHDVTMIELLESSTNHARKLAEKMKINIEIINNDFYRHEFEQQYDLICYFDSFGIGNDNDQRRLLKRIYSWLKPKGCAVIEIGSSLYWGGVARGKSMDLGNCMRQYDFDANNCRLIDQWWRKAYPKNIVNQSLRCYTPADLKLLLEGTGLKLVTIHPGGKIDYEIPEFIENAPLEEAMTFYVKLTKT